MSAVVQTRRWSTRRKLLLQLALLPLVLLAAELGYRVLLRARAAPYDAQTARRDLAVLVGNLNSPFPEPEQQDDGERGAEQKTPDVEVQQFLHPYLGFDMSDFAESEARDVEYFASPRSAAAYDVLIVGGSVSARFGKFGTERLAELLRADPRLADREIRFLEHGRGAFKQPQQVVLVGFLLSMGYRPDAVLNIDGFNEVALGNDNAVRGTHPIYPSVTSWGRHAQAGNFDWESIELLHEIRSLQTAARELGDRALRGGWMRSALIGKPVLARLEGLQVRSKNANDAFQEGLTSGADARVLQGPPFDPGTSTALRVAVRGWMESSRALQSMCRARGIHYLHVLQPTLYDEGSKPLTVRERRKGKTIQSWTDGATLGYPLLRTAGERLRLTDVNFLDASQAFAEVEQRLYFDVCHFLPPGHLILAETIAPAFLATMP